MKPILHLLMNGPIVIILVGRLRSASGKSGGTI